MFPGISPLNPDRLRWRGLWCLLRTSAFWMYLLSISFLGVWFSSAFLVHWLIKCNVRTGLLILNIDMDLLVAAWEETKSVVDICQFCLESSYTHLSTTSCQTDSSTGDKKPVPLNFNWSWTNTVMEWNKINSYRNEVKEKKQVQRKYKLTFFIIRFILTYFSVKMLWNI